MQPAAVPPERPHPDPPYPNLAEVGPPPQVKAAGVLVSVQGLAAVAFAVLLGVRAGDLDLSVAAVLGEAVAFLVLGLPVLAAGIALWRGRRWARTPAIVVQLLLLPVVYSLIGPSQQLLLGILTGLYVVATFLLLISERSRTWSVDDPSPS